MSYMFGTLPYMLVGSFFGLSNGDPEIISWFT
uniref:Uncharacterized protein n=1 Tax=Rhizophora mucronata TaxID=61149 RepID=A0A2P2K6M6_RHIMU